MLSIATLKLPFYRQGNWGADPESVKPTSCCVRTWATACNVSNTGLCPLTQEDAQGNKGETRNREQRDFIREFWRTAFHRGFNSSVGHFKWPDHLPSGCLETSSLRELQLSYWNSYSWALPVLCSKQRSLFRMGALWIPRDKCYLLSYL